MVWSLLLSCFRYHKGTDFQANHNAWMRGYSEQTVVLDTTKVQIFKQITTGYVTSCRCTLLFQIPQRYRFSSKSQQQVCYAIRWYGCFRYHKGTDFQANHNAMLGILNSMSVVLDTTKVQIFKQITTVRDVFPAFDGCFRYHKGTDFQANHNPALFKRIQKVLFQIPQRYRFSSKSQHSATAYTNGVRCFRYHKGTDFQANHNKSPAAPADSSVVLDTTKVQIFKQITTKRLQMMLQNVLFQIPQRYRFSSKSQHKTLVITVRLVVLDTTKVQIFKQITTLPYSVAVRCALFQIPQRYRFSSKSQPFVFTN